MVSFTAWSWSETAITDTRRAQAIGNNLSSKVRSNVAMFFVPGSIGLADNRTSSFNQTATTMHVFISQHPERLRENYSISIFCKTDTGVY